MKKTLCQISMLLLAPSLAACATSESGSAGSGASASVTRVHLGGEIARGEIRVEPANPERANSLEFAQMAASVERELNRLGWNVARGNARSEQVALVRLEQGSREAMRSRPNVSTGGRAGSSNEIVVTELAVRIQRRSDATVAWEGRAELEARQGSALAHPGAAADRLAAALFQDFPGESGRTIRIR
jgi:hypothetical protein